LIGVASVLVGLIAAENMEDVKSLGGVIDLKANTPLADPQPILWRINPDEAAHVACSLDRETIERL